MKILIFTLLFVLGTYSSFAAPPQERRETLISLLDEEILELTRLAKQTKDKNPNHIFRLAELFLEKARLLKDSETEKYLTVPAKERSNVDKSEYFKGSRVYFLKAQKACEILISKYDKFPQKADVYYILAFNAKEFNDQTNAKKFLTAAEQIAKKNSPVAIRAKIALAEMYYNQGKYHEAIPLYEEALGSSKDKWWTKDSYNLAWCYLRTRNNQKAIEKLLAVHKLSQDPKYIDMSSMTKRDMAYFYTEAGMINEAVAFYKDNRIDIAQNLIKVSKYLMDQGKSSTAESVLTEALKYKTGPEQEVEIQITLLNLYEKFGKIEGHLQSSKALVPLYKKGLIDEDSKKTYVYQVGKMASVLQKQVVEKTYETQPEERMKRAKLAVQYFEVLSEIESKRAYEHLFYAGETLFAISSFDDAMKYYVRAQEAGKDKNDPKTNSKILNAMFATSGKLKGDQQEEYLLKTYYLYLKLHPNDPKSDKIYQRLFTIYNDKKDIKRSEETLLQYKKAFPDEIKVQEAMLARIMDYHKEKNDRAAMRSWVTRINNKEFAIGPEYAQKLKLLLLTMQFDDVEKASSVGDKKKALKGYLDIYKAPESNNDGKKNAAFNVAILFHELGDFERSYSWIMKAISLMKPEEIAKFERQFLAMGNDYFGKQYFTEAITFYRSVLDKVCGTKNKNEKIFFKNALVIALAEKEMSIADKLISKASKCEIPAEAIHEAKLEMLGTLVDDEKWDEALKWVGYLQSEVSLNGLLIKPTYKIMTALSSTGRKSEAAKLKTRMFDFYEKASKAKAEVPLDALDIIANYRLGALTDLQKNLEEIRLVFPDTKYNQILKKKFEMLDQVTAAAIDLMEIRSGRGVVRAYKIMISSYETMAKEILEFKLPEDKSPEYAEAFKKAMTKVSQPILQKAREYRAEASKRIYQNQILSKDNVWFHTTLNLPFTLEHYSAQSGVLMDRGGTD